MSRGRNFAGFKAALSSRARARRSLGATRVGNSTASKHTIASLFMLLLCSSAEAFSRSYTASGMFFKVSVVGMRQWLQSATIMVFAAQRVNRLSPSRYEPKLKPGTNGKRPYEAGSSQAVGFWKLPPARLCDGSYQQPSLAAHRDWARRARSG
jgi:hypothetical protein